MLTHMYIFDAKLNIYINATQQLCFCVSSHIISWSNRLPEMHVYTARLFGGLEIAQYLCKIGGKELLMLRDEASFVYDGTNALPGHQYLSCNPTSYVPIIVKNAVLHTLVMSKVAHLMAMLLLQKSHLMVLLLRLLNLWSKETDSITMYHNSTITDYLKGDSHHMWRYM
jgi:hypothetical protein